MNNKLFGKNEYQKISKDHASSYMIMGYKIPGKEPAVYTEHGLEYHDLDGHQQIIPKKKIPEFLATIRKTDDPWLQEAFSKLFRQQADPFQFQFHDKSIGDFAQFLNDLPIAANLDYRLLLLGARAAQLQRVHKGDSRSVEWSKESKHLQKLYKTLTESLQQFEIKKNNLEAHPHTRHTHAELVQYIKTLEDQWGFAINATRDKFAEDWDTRNLLLNIAAITTGIGFLLLMIKNIWLKAEGEDFELFQFQHAHSEQRDVLYNLRDETMVSLKKLSHFKVDKTDHLNQQYFTNDIETTKKSLAELSYLCQDLRTQIDFRIDSTDSTPLRQSKITFLNGVHADLDFALQTCVQEIAALQKKGGDPQSVDFRHRKMNAERALMDKWQQTIMTIPTSAKQTISFGLSLTNALFKLYPVAQRFTEELALFHDADESNSPSHN